MNPETLPDGLVILWIVFCPETLEMVLRCTSRAEARQMARKTGGRVAKVVVAH